MIDYKFQQRLGVWVESTFGKDRASDAHERALRFLEEAIELCQVVGVTEEQAKRFVEYVFDRPVGHLRQEVGGCALTLAALCNAAGEELSECAHAEMDRVEDPEVAARYRARQAEKDRVLGRLEIDFQAGRGTSTPMSMKVVYIAGPFTGKDAWEVACNVHRAEALTREVVRLGAAPLCPHSIGAHFSGAGDYEFWVEATVEMMRRCDAVLFTTDYERSSGAIREEAEAKRIGLPRFYSVAELSAWLAIA